METALDWRNYSQAWIDETEARMDIDSNKLCSYGLSPLDDALFRIGKNELVVIGAETGSGKSELGLSIAQHNAKQGRTVAVYYLEGGHLEAIQRMKWKEITKRYYEKYFSAGIDIDFKKWAFNHDQSELLTKIEGEVYNEIATYKDRLYFYPINKDFTIEQFMGSLLDFQEWINKKLYLDLIVIDHLQYFSLDNAENEITEITKIIREVKHLTDYYQTPVILISHLRKRGKNAGLPSHEDFYGSSNIPKISTTSIMISPATDKDRLAQNIYPTYFRIVKCRTGVRPNYAFLIDYDLTNREYNKTYELYRVNSLGQVSDTPLPGYEVPKWARQNIKNI